MTGSSLIRGLRFMAASLLFYLPLAVWFALGISGRLEGMTQERFDHISGMIALGCSALFLIIGIPVVLPRAWNGSVQKGRLLTQGRPVRGFLRSVGERAEERSEGETSVRMLLEMEIEEHDGRYLTAPDTFDVPAEAASLLHPGMELPLRVDPGNRYSFTIDWINFMESGRNR